MDDNKKLVDWAVDNIDKWPTGYTHLRCDLSAEPLFWSDENWNSFDGHTWEGTGNWQAIDSSDHQPPLVAASITREEWEAAKHSRLVSEKQYKASSAMIEHASIQIFASMCKDLAPGTEQEIIDDMAKTAWCAAEAWAKAGENR